MTERGAEVDGAEPSAATTAEPEVDADGTTTKVRRRAPGADPEVRSFGTERTCSAEGCDTKLSRYNPDSFCSMHRGWDRQVVTRRRRTPD
ncbi:MAG TPA: hypothetical protein VKG45_09145 [Actinomycetes bacterium]|nr:hypothetical protein [Actinomycetes bacterium]